MDGRCVVRAVNTVAAVPSNGICDDLPLVLAHASLGFLLASLGPYVLLLAAELHRPPEQLAWLPSTFGAGLIVVAVLGSVLTRAGAGTVLRIAALAVALGATIAAATPLLPAAATAALLIGVGCAAIVLATPALLRGPTAAARLIRVTAAASSAGIAAPLLIAAAERSGLHGRLMLLAPLPALLVLAVRRPFPPPAPPLPAPAGTRVSTRAVATRWVRIVLAVSSEFCFIVWGAARVRDAGASVAAAAALSSAFPIGMAIGRLAGPRLVARDPAARAACLTAIAGTGIVCALPGPWPVAAGLGLAGHRRALPDQSGPAHRNRGPVRRSLRRAGGPRLRRRDPQRPAAAGRRQLRREPAGGLRAARPAAGSPARPVDQPPWRYLMNAPGVALVTGASRGLGAAIARRLAADGWAVAVNYRAGADLAARVVEDIRAAGGTAAAFGADVTDEHAVTDLVDRISDQLGPVEVLVANATGPQPVVAIEDVTWQVHLDQLLFFVKSPTLLLRAVLPGMKARHHGRVIQIGSDMYERALPGWSAYVAAKGAQLGLTRTWARELGPAGITANLVAPGWIPVERHADASPEELADYLAGVPVGRFGQPDDVAAAVSFLASDSAGFVTGQRITVSGGHTID